MAVNKSYRRNKREFKSEKVVLVGRCTSRRTKIAILAPNTRDELGGGGRLAVRLHGGVWNNHNVSQVASVATNMAFRKSLHSKKPIVYLKDSNLIERDSFGNETIIKEIKNTPVENKQITLKIKKIR